MQSESRAAQAIRVIRDERSGSTGGWTNMRFGKIAALFLGAGGATIVTMLVLQPG